MQSPASTCVVHSDLCPGENATLRLCALASIFALRGVGWETFYCFYARADCFEKRLGVFGPRKVSVIGVGNCFDFLGELFRDYFCGDTSGLLFSY